MTFNRLEIGELVSLRQGFAINKKTNYHISEKRTNLPLLRIGDMKDGEFKVFVRDTIPDKFIAKKSDVIYTRTGQVGAVFRGQLGVIHNNCFTVNTKDETVLLQDFIFYMLQEKAFYEEAVSRATGAAQPDLPHGAFNSIQVFLPPIDSQRNIIKILSDYDNLIENNQKQIKLLEEAAQRLYKEWFIDLRFPGHGNVEIVDGIPIDWRRNTLESFVDVIMGQSPKSIFYNKDGKGIAFHQGVGSYGDRFVIDSIYSTSTTRIAEAGSILFSVRAPVGRLNITKNRIIIGRGLAALKQKNNYQSFLFYMLKEFFFRDNIVGNGSIFASITKNELLSLSFIFPNEKLIKRFNDVAISIDKKIEYLDMQIGLLTEARDRLLPKLMSGEIEV